MPDIIKLLPEHIANQIAAGEVIQRPASVVKEMMENAVDAGADDIILIIKDAGKTIIQIIDNGKGMVEQDAVRCFDRHATSKIKNASDLFDLHTFGFRGEALASIASIAHVELKTKTEEDETGVKVEVEGSAVNNVEPCICPKGSSFAVKNIFYNVPARRNFLKSDSVEFRHILEEFNRVALIYPNISFTFTNNGKQVFKLHKSNLKQRIISLMGIGFNNTLYPVHLKTGTVEIGGFVGKPESAKKIRGNQYFFVNGRYIKSAYFNHAVEQAFKESICSDEFPSYFIYFTCDPKRIDINIHPTKTEVKFMDDKEIYAYLRSAVREAIGKFGCSDKIDFDNRPSFEFNSNPSAKPVSMPKNYTNLSYNPFKNDGAFDKDKNGLRNWEKLFEDRDKSSDRDVVSDKFTFENVLYADDNSQLYETGFQMRKFIQLSNNYIVTNVKSGLAVIDRRAATERILFDRFIFESEHKKPSSQQALFPQTLDLTASDAELLKDTLNDFKEIGFDIDEFGGNSFVINGTPFEVDISEAGEVIEGILENYKRNLMEIKSDRKTNIMLSTAKRMAAKEKGVLSDVETQELVNALFRCRVHDVSPSGKSIIKIITFKEIENLYE